VRGLSGRRLPQAGLVLCLVGALARVSPAGVAPRGSGRTPEDPKPAERLDASGGVAPARGSEGTAVLDEHGSLFLEIPVGPGDTEASLGGKYLADPRAFPSLKPRKGETRRARNGTVRLSYAALNDTYRRRTIRDLFPRDGPRGGDWVHRAGEGRIPAAEESLWHLALWFTGRGENFEILADRNGIPELSPKDGQEIVIPGEILLPAFGGKQAPAETGGAPAEAAGTASPEDDFTEASPEAEPESPGPHAVAPGTVPQAEGAEDLSYATDSEGRHATYRLKQGEALYSAVVVRFTGRIDAQDVNELAQQIARRSGIGDVTDIPIGFKVKIPLDDLLPEYLPRDDPRRQGWERTQAEVALYTNRVSSSDLNGVAVILDAGHGGRDPGAFHNGVWEHDYVYDILCRIKLILETRTRARVLPTIKDRKEGFAVRDATRLTRNGAEVLLTDPPFSLKTQKASVNLRWYLSNAYYRRLESEGFNPLKIVFTSLHADARHPSLRGAMIYVPGEAYRRGRYGHGGAVYTRYREVREAPYVAFPRGDRERSEGLSRQFASSLVKAFRGRGVSVHPFGPVRERIIRRGRSWVPAVLRCNVVPVEVLIEVSNLSNPADSRQLADPAYRQKVAEAYVDALILYYGGPSPAPRPSPARSGR
jgi:N-acetylmuramoyl-L-alanine amidase